MEIWAVWVAVLSRPAPGQCLLTVSQGSLDPQPRVSASKATRQPAETPELGPQPGEPWPCQRQDLFLIWCGKFLNLSCGMAFAPCRKGARGPGGSNWFQSRSSCWNPAALIRKVHFQVAVPSWWSPCLPPNPTQCCQRSPPKLKLLQPSIQSWKPGRGRKRV